MGMYTELILGANLKRKTPSEIIDALKYLTAEMDSQKTMPIPNNLPAGDRIPWMFHSGGSYCFGAQSGYRAFNYDNISETYRISARFNIKNYDHEIESFLEWLKPWIEQGSGSRGMYAIVTYEEASEPTIYYLND